MSALTIAEIKIEDEIVVGCRSEEILSRLPRRLSHQILSWIEKTPEAIALQEADQNVTYSQLGLHVAEARALLLQRGVRAGDRVMLVAENGIALMVLFLALSELDGIAAVINARL